MKPIAKALLLIVDKNGHLTPRGKNLAEAITDELATALLDHREDLPSHYGDLMDTVDDPDTRYEAGIFALGILVGRLSAYRKEPDAPAS